MVFKFQTDQTKGSVIFYFKGDGEHISYMDHACQNFEFTIKLFNK